MRAIRVLGSFGAAVVSFLVAAPLAAQASVDRVATDAIVIERVAEASDRDLPVRLLERMVKEDIELLRGRRADGSYEFASFERFEGSRVSQSFSVQPREDRMDTFQMRGANVYRVVIDVPSRRMVLRRNRPIWIERIDVEYVPDGSSQARTETFEVKAWLQPDESRPIDLPAIARQATVKIVATADPKGGYGNIEVALVQARIVDKADSPYAGAVTAARAVERALADGNATTVRAAARRMGESLGSRMTVAAGAAAMQPAAAGDPAARLEMQAELQVIEDLLTGSESERRDGLDRLHQLIRRMR
jgi:hypothetical protein